MTRKIKSYFTDFFDEKNVDSFFNVLKAKKTKIIFTYCKKKPVSLCSEGSFHGSDNVSLFPISKSELEKYMVASSE